MAKSNNGEKRLKRQTTLERVGKHEEFLQAQGKALGIHQSTLLTLYGLIKWTWRDVFNIHKWIAAVYTIMIDRTDALQTLIHDDLSDLEEVVSEIKDDVVAVKKTKANSLSVSELRKDFTNFMDYDNRRQDDIHESIGALKDDLEEAKQGLVQQGEALLILKETLEAQERFNKYVRLVLLCLCILLGGLIGFTVYLSINLEHVWVVLGQIQNLIGG